MDPCHIAGRARVEVGQQSRHAIGQKCLARPRWPDEQQVMAAGSGRLEGAARHRLAEDIGQIADGSVHTSRHPIRANG
jgi:hypothetical protein